MGQISVSDHVHTRLKERKSREGHKSLDSVIRVLIERAKQAPSVNEEHSGPVKEMDRSDGSIEVSVGEATGGGEIDSLLPQEELTPTKAQEFLKDHPLADTHDVYGTYVRNRDLHDLSVEEALHSALVSVCDSSDVEGADGVDDVVDLINSHFHESTRLDIDAVRSHVIALAESPLDFKLYEAECILKKFYETEGVPYRDTRSVEAHVDEVFAFLEEVSESENPRETMWELFSNPAEHDYSLGTLWLLAPLSPDVRSTVTDDGNIHLGPSSGVAWICSNCHTEGHHTTIDAVRLDEYGEVSQLQCGSCGGWSNYTLNSRLPIKDGQNVRVEWESDQPWK